MEIHNKFELRKFVAPEFIFGEGSINLAGQYARNFNARRVLIVTDPGIIQAGWAKVVETSLEAHGIGFLTFSNITPNPKAEEVMQGAELFHNSRCDCIVAVGGGSSIDCAKGIGIVASNRRHILEFEGVDKVQYSMPPIICIPTTAGTAADVSQFAIITDSNEKLKKAIVSKVVVPDVALIDPTTTTTMPNYLTACTGIDCLVHAIEAFVSNASSMITDVHAMEAIRLASKYLLRVLREPNNMEYRTKMMMASLEAGLAFSNASLGVTHAMAHSLGGLTDVAHGECNSILVDHVLEFNFKGAPDRYARIGDAMGLNLKGEDTKSIKKSILAEISRLKKEAKINNRLSSIGIGFSDIPYLAKNAMHDICVVTNPRKPVEKDIEVIYEEAL
ncbi:MAG: alcohol dehydrogenase-like regulatory protein ErcA [Bacteroidota bacterium]|nr:alcohol dehydrogenase-like regulatory protein ErcA [Bacteroidota bacterium]MDP4191950.1 alcohol dehydrogenase-like regulatory protein ErcA [Bacteroidota bacterium]MDP4194003.1 alcohol dehydrogenase-like regulatory protein ErcA [Bacteroidota bacterium]